MAKRKTSGRRAARPKPRRPLNPGQTPVPVATPVTTVPSALVAAKPPASVWIFIAFAWVIGWWLTYDGLRQRLTGDFTRINGELGPWADLARAVGIDPLSLGWFFVVLGLGFVAASFGVYLQHRWGYNVGLAASFLGLSYLGFGTPVALVCLIALLLRSTRDYVLARRAA